MDLPDIIQAVSQIEGWFYEEQMTILHPIISALSTDAVLVEIGTYHGRSTLFFRLSNPNIDIITIDLCKPYEAINGMLVNPPPAIDDRIIQYGRIVQIIGESSDVASRFERDIDCLFVDGNHTYGGVQKDITAWMPKVRGGGWVIFHDYDPQYEGVIRAVDELERSGGLERLYAESLLFVGRKT